MLEALLLEVHVIADDAAVLAVAARPAGIGDNPLHGVILGKDVGNQMTNPVAPGDHGQGL